MDAIVTNGLSLRMGDGFALRDVTLALPVGATLAVVGGPAAGKSALLDLLVNLVRPSSGEAEVLGVDSRRIGAREFQRIGYLAQERRLPVDLSLHQLLRYWRPFYKNWDQPLVDALKIWFSLPEETPVGRLEKHMRVKSAHLLALAFHPELLILDEPFSDVDATVRGEMLHGVARLRERKPTTVFYSAREAMDAAGACDHVALMHDGRLRHIEAVGSLSARFRAVTVVLPHAGHSGVDYPGALELTREGREIRFVASNFAGEETISEWETMVPGSGVTARTMSTLEIIEVLLRLVRQTQAKS